MKTTLLSIALIAISFANGQVLDFNNTSANVAANGFLEGYEVPKNSGIEAIYSMSLCMAGVDATGTLKSALGTFSQNDSDFFPGPVSYDGSLISYYNDPVYQNAYANSIWEVSLAEIQNHISNFNQVGYVMPVGIATWPGNGVAGVGVAQNLASFVDLNSNGLYEPSLGDYPEIRGDFATLVIMNDWVIGGNSVSYPMGVEVHALFYQFESNDYLDNTTFVNYKVINRSTQTFFDFKLGLYTDFELGNSTDDFIGCDSTRNLMYAYNGDNLDENNGPFLGYSANPPSIGIVSLNHQIDNVVALRNSSSFPYSDPTAPIQFYNLMDGKWNDGSYRYFGGDGMNTSGVPTSFMFSGNPANQTGWSEAGESNFPGDRRGFMSTSKPVFQPYQFECFDFAIIYAREPGNDNLQNVQALMDIATTAQNDFDAMTTYNCNVLYAGIEELNESQIGLFPNPTNGMFSLSFGDESLNGTITILDLNGKVVFAQDFDNSSLVDLELNVFPGIYHAAIQTNKGTINKKLVITD